MPWRQTKDPYKIWLSEIILQQTRVAQGLPYYEKFLAAFPTVAALAAANEESVLKLWQGLGYYSRARNMHAAAKTVMEAYDGQFPTTYTEIIKLKGVGDYTASAIASICFDEPTAVVDGNVYRVLSRIFKIETPINSTLGQKEFKKLAQVLIDPKQPANFNQAIMEFGAIQCKPQNPYCLHCTFNDSCLALATNTISALPVKLKKTTVKHRYLNYLYIRSKDGQTLLQLRQKKGIWQGLYEFPKIEVVDHQSPFRESKALREIIDTFSVQSISQYNQKPIVHKLSHQHLHTIFWILEVEKLPDTAIPIEKLRDYPVPVLISNFIDTFVDHS